MVAVVEMAATMASMATPVVAGLGGSSLSARRAASKVQLRSGIPLFTEFALLIYPVHVQNVSGLEVLSVRQTVVQTRSFYEMPRFVCLSSALRILRTDRII